MAGTGTSAEIAERAASRFEMARQLTFGTFLVSAVVLGVLPLFALAQAYDRSSLGLPLTVLAGIGVAVFLVAFVRLVRAGLDGRAPGRRDLVGSGALVVALSALMGPVPVLAMVGPFWASAVALSATRRQLAPLCLGTALVCATLSQTSAPDGPDWSMWPVMFGVFLGVSVVAVGTNLVQKWMWDLIREAYAAREAQARLAVTEERLRISRDLHDLLGHNLSLIAVKSELAIRMSEADAGRARAEMADVRQAARDALREVRSAVRGYRAVELDAELAGVRAVLAAAGVRCEVGDPPAGLPEDVRGVLAWVVREGATNVLKHSDARRCEISLTAFEGAAVLEMSNDGVRPSAPAPDGTGLTGLAERVAGVSGGLTAGPAGGDRFLLRVTVPLPGAR